MRACFMVVTLALVVGSYSFGAAEAPKGVVASDAESLLHRMASNREQRLQLDREWANLALEAGRLLEAEGRQGLADETYAQLARYQYYVAGLPHDFRQYMLSRAIIAAERRIVIHKGDLAALQEMHRSTPVGVLRAVRASYHSAVEDAGGEQWLQSIESVEGQRIDYGQWAE